MSIILTFDYELFGSGQGCFKKHIIDPTEQIRSILRKYDVKATFFIEYLELLQYRNNLDSSSSMACNNCLLLPKIEAQISSLYSEGHDIQLHVHPQWRGAVYDASQKSFNLNFDLWRFSDLPLKNQTPIIGMIETLIEGKDYLSSLINNKSYKCHGFRAGGYNIGNLKKTVDALRTCGFIFDSSVYAGGYCDTYLSKYDYTSIDRNAPYYVGNKILEPSCRNKKNLIEFPIFSHTKLSSDYYSLPRTFAFLKNKRFKSIPTKSINHIKMIKSNKVKKSSTNWDVCLTGKTETYRFINDYIHSGISTPITLIGHPKDFTSFSWLESLLEHTKNRFTFQTMTDAAEHMINHIDC